VREKRGADSVLCKCRGGRQTSEGTVLILSQVEKKIGGGKALMGEKGRSQSPDSASEVVNNDLVLSKSAGSYFWTSRKEFTKVVGHNAANLE